MDNPNLGNKSYIGIVKWSNFDINTQLTKNRMKPIESFLVGGTSIGAIELLAVIPTDPNTILGLCKVLGQIAIGVVTLIGMIKSWKKKND